MNDVVFTCTILVYNQMTSVLFDSSSAYFYVSVKFVLSFNMICDTLDNCDHVSTLVGESVVLTHVYRFF